MLLTFFTDCYLVCENGGTPIQGCSICNCTEGWTGVNCSENFNECNSDPCQNGGTCTDGLNNYTCKCPDLFAGKNCEQLSGDYPSNPFTVIPNFQIFLGHMPPDPLASSCYTCWMCFAH